MSASVDILFERWRQLREDGKCVLPEWLCAQDPHLLEELRGCIASHLGHRRTPKEGVRLIAASANGAAEADALLHRRLLWIACGFLSCGAVWLIWDTLDPAPDLVDWRIQCANVLLLLLAAVALHLNRQPSRVTLKIAEAVVFGVAILYSAWAHYQHFARPWIEEVIRPGKEKELMEVFGDSLALPWVLLILVYATFIPNRWSRCAVVTSVLVAIPVLLSLPVLLSSHPLARHIPYALMEMLIWLLLSAALTIWGVRKLDSANHEAEAAREYGQYRLKKPLGRGGMGEVYLAEHRLLDRPCAIKVIRGEKALDRVHLSRFEREVRTLAQLTHWNIVQVFDFGTASDGSFYFVMEYLPGLDLRQLVDAVGPLPAERVIYLLRQACWGLREAHAVGLVHRDIKPSNIIVCERGRIFDVVKLVDFGLVQERTKMTIDDHLTREGSFVGTPAFMSPEQISGDELDGRSDLYSLGAVAYFLLTGHPPFPHDSLHKVLKAQLTEEVAPPARLAAMPADLNDIVIRCLAKDPADRYADAESLERALGMSCAANLWTMNRAAGWWRQFALDESTG